MEKRSKRIIYFSLAFLVLALVVVAILDYSIFLKYFIVPMLSPFFPELAPFEASVSIDMSNTAPLINITKELFVCEDRTLLHFFNVSDNEGGPLALDISPKNPFFVLPFSIPKDITKKIFEARIISLGSLGKSHVDRNLGYKLYQEILSVIDGDLSAIDGELSDFKQVNITVIEINHAPNISRIGVQTIWTHGDNGTFNYQVKVNDIEDGNQDSGNLIFNLTFLNNGRLFNVSRNGTMSFNVSKELNLSEINVPATYNISVCVKDSGLRAAHARIMLECGQDGSAFEACENFSLTITDENRAPVIVENYPRNLNLSVKGETILYFNITDYDADGTIPDTYWYVDNNFIEYDEGDNSDEFNYSFGCGVSGNHKVKVEVTDGLLNNSLEWNLTVEGVACPEQVSSGGWGGGGSAIKKCDEKWVCLNWNVCQNAQSSLELGLLSGDDYRDIKELCRLDFFGDNCGFHIRECYDSSFCNTSIKRPEKIGHCYFVLNPSCSDRIKNCHDGDCEVLVDCGGPCAPCPTCSDSVQNQGEEGIDCGGPCPLKCPEKTSVLKNFKMQYILLFVLILLFIIIVVELIRIWREKRKMKNMRME